MRKRKDCQGVITVFIALMLASVFSLGTLVIEASRYQAAKTQLLDATVSAGNSMLAAYNSELYERYGLLAIDTDSFTMERCRDYLDYNGDLASSFFGNNLTRMYSIKSVELQGLYNFTYPSVIKRQILNRAKYHVVPQDYALNRYNINSFFSELKSKCQYVSSALETVANGSGNGSNKDITGDMKSALTSLYKTYLNIQKHDDACAAVLDNSSVALLPSKTGTVESVDTSSDVEAIQNTLSNVSTTLGGDTSHLAMTEVEFSQTDVNVDISFISGMVSEIKDASTVSDVKSVAKKYATKCRSLAQGINAAINMLSTDTDGNLLLNSYIANYFSNRNYSVNGYVGPGKKSSFSGESSNFAAACAEYLFGGNNSEISNQEKAYDYILAMRLVNNLYDVFNSSNSFNPNSVYSTLAHICWGYYESATDTQLLTFYNTGVPFNKEDLFLNPNNCANVNSAFSSRSFIKAMQSLGVHNGTAFTVKGSSEFSYKDSLALALWILPNSDKMMRIADLIQLEMRYNQKYVQHKTASFLMSEQNTFCRVQCTAKINSILPVISVGSDGGGIGNVTFKNVRYSGY